MSFADPAVITINGVAKSLVRVRQDGYSSEYRLLEATQDFKLNIRNSQYTDKKRGAVINRHNAELVHTVFPVAPATLSIVRKVYVVIENQQGDTLVDPINDAAALLTFLNASSSANIAKMMNTES